MPTFNGLIAAFLAGAVFASPAVAADVGGAKSVDFIALGDMPYKLPDDYARFEALIQRVNAMKPAFTIHVGDIKAGSTPCTDENFQRVKDEFAMFDGALVYVVGDNEWTDCHRERAGKFNPVERLNKVREMFFAEPKSLGKAPIALERQAEVSPDIKTFDGKLFVENTRFARNGVMFLQVHVPGSNNNFETRTLENVQEYFARDKANVAWIKDTFAKAKADNASALVLSLQAELWDIRQSFGDLPLASGFINTIDAIEKGAKDFGKPVLVINGDVHIFTVTPFFNNQMKAVPNITRLQVMGETTVGAVRVIVDPENPTSPFAFQPINEPAKATN